MQYADFESAALDLEAEIARLVESRFLTSEAAQTLNRKKIRAFLHSDLYARMRGASRLIREYKFFYFIPAGEVDPDLNPPFSEEKILVQGIADCLLFEPDGITIIDYKTDFVTAEEELISRYYDQLRIYRDAMAQAFPDRINECLLYSLHLEREIRLPL